MKKCLPFGFALLLLAATVALGQESKPAASPSPAPKPAMSKAQIQRNLVAMEKKLWEAWKNKDPKPFRATVTNDSVGNGEMGPQNKTALVKAISENPCEVKSYTLSDWKMTMVDSDAALLTYKGTVDGTCAGQAIPTVWSSSLYVRRGGKWMAFFHQESNTK